jgi:AcrR family transcriptional regulator
LAIVDNLAMTTPPQARLRSDARRNRDQIVAAAKVLFVEAGTDLPMEEIARRADVGVGTLYRRFPDRDTLIRAVAEDGLRGVLDDARTAQAEEPTAWAALVRLLRHSPNLRLMIRLALQSKRAWTAAREDPQTGRFRREIMGVLDELVTGAQAEGALRTDVGSGDVAALISLLVRPVPASSGAFTEVVLERALVVMLDGLRASPGTPLPGRPITGRDLRVRR